MLEFEKKMKVRVPTSDSAQASHCFAVYGISSELMKQNWGAVINLVTEELRLKITKIYYEFDSNPSNTMKSVSSIDKLKRKLEADGRGLSYVVCEEIQKEIPPEHSRSVSIRTSDGSLFVCFEASTGNAISTAEVLSNAIAFSDRPMDFLFMGQTRFLSILGVQGLPSME